MPENRFSLEVNKADLTRLKRKMKQLEDLVGGKKQLQASLNHIGSQAVGRMKRDARVDTGRLRRNVKKNTKRRSLVITSNAYDPNTGRNYAPLYRDEYFDPNVRWTIENLFKDLRRRIDNIFRR